PLPLHRRPAVATPRPRLDAAGAALHRIADAHGTRAVPEHSVEGAVTLNVAIEAAAFAERQELRDDLPRRICERCAVGIAPRHVFSDGQRGELRLEIGDAGDDTRLLKHFAVELGAIRSGKKGEAPRSPLPPAIELDA